MRHCFVFVFILLCFSSVTAESISFRDVPWDDGKALELHWDLPFVPDSVALSISDPEGNLIPAQIKPEQTGMLLIGDLNTDFEYNAHLVAYHDNQPFMYQATGQAQEQWFYLHKSAFLILLFMICAAIIYYITAAKRGKDFFIRRIAGLDSMEEAIGRATEKGKPILFVPGIGDLDDIQTIASLTILSHLAQRSAEYNTELIVPCRFSMVLSAAREVVKEAYMKVGRIDAYKPDSVFYLTDDQFGYVAGIDGIMLREQPAANFFLGSFYAESLILAETGHSTGAIQTAGTAQAHQLPFFVVSCDYTLIGEELFAASAYLSRDPQQLGSLKGHDFGKLLVILLIIAGVILEIAGISNLKDFIAGALT